MIKVSSYVFDELLPSGDNCYIKYETKMSQQKTNTLELHLHFLYDIKAHISSVNRILTIPMVMTVIMINKNADSVISQAKTSSEISFSPLVSMPTLTFTRIQVQYALTIQYKSRSWKE